MRTLLATLLIAVITNVLGAGAVVTSTTGMCSVQTGQASPRTLRTGDQIAQGDTIMTGANSATVLKFDDGHVVALTANSRMQVTNYQYNPQTESGNVLLSLVSGGMRAITGLIGRRAPNQVAYRAATATIGIRGTDITVASSEGTVVVTVTEGAVEFHFQSETLIVNAGEAVMARPGEPAIRGTATQVLARAPSAIQQAVAQQAALVAAVTNANPGNPPQGQQGQGEAPPQGQQGGWWGWFPWIGSAPPGDRDLAANEKPNATLVQVLYATNRMPTRGSNLQFGGGRSPVLRYGVCDVSIPKSHIKGELESPLIKVDWLTDEKRHIKLVKTTAFTQQQFLIEVRNRVGKGQNAFVFVHGYNVTFEDAARRTAQMHVDLEFEGAPVFFSWPSQGAPISYSVDEANVQDAEFDLKNFLSDFFHSSSAQNIYLIAHSMGSRALTNVIASVVSEKPEYRERLKEVILAAPDIDANVFKRQIVPALASAGRPVTLYVSSRDIALLFSKGFHGYSRAGDAGSGLVIAPGVETIDASAIGEDVLGHSDFATSRAAIGDISYLIKQALRPDRRFGLKAIDTPSGRYWEFVK